LFVSLNDLYFCKDVEIATIILNYIENLTTLKLHAESKTRPI